MQPKQIKLIQIIAELAIPLLGYFYWKWNIFFIFLFLFLDLVANTVLLHFKQQKIKEHQNERTTILPYYLMYLVGLSGVFYGALLCCQKIIPDFDFYKQVHTFFFLKDMGISQGYLLVPLIVLTGIMQYKAEFKNTKKYVSTKLSRLLNLHLLGILLPLVGAFFIFGLLQFMQIPQLILICVLLGGCATYSYFFKRA